MTNLYLDSLRKKKDNTQINKIRNEREVTVATREIQRITQEYYKKLLVIKFDDQEEVDKFLKYITFLD